MVDRPRPFGPKSRYIDNRPTTWDIQTIHGRFGSRGCSTSSSKRHAREAKGQAEEKIYNLSLPAIKLSPPISFANEDLRGLHLPHDNALVVSTTIANFNIQWFLIENKSSTDILFFSAFDKIKIWKDKLHPFHTPIIKFVGGSIHPIGWIKLHLTMGMGLHQTTMWQNFIVVDCSLSYNTILGCSTVEKIKSNTSTYHLVMKFPTTIGIGEVKGDQKVCRQCFLTVMKPSNK